jgi:hypothetical protein
MGEKLSDVSGEQRRLAIISQQAPRDILSGNSRKLTTTQPTGIPASKLNPEQKRQLLTLIGEYAHRLRTELANQDLHRIKHAGNDNIFFAWGGWSR